MQLIDLLLCLINASQLEKNPFEENALKILSFILLYISSTHVNFNSVDGYSLYNKVFLIIIFVLCISFMSENCRTLSLLSVSIFSTLTTLRSNGYVQNVHFVQECRGTSIKYRSG